jgi:peptidyl-prolyl cis-trans isomerase B (cyclophilin B)
MALYTPEYQPTGEEIAVIETSKGTIRVRLAGSDAPIHVANFVELAEKGFYDGLKFHRHEPGFVIQGGCPNTRTLTPDEVRAGKPGPDGPAGTGNPGYSIKGEWTVNPHNQHRDGTLAMARSQMPDSAGSQFYFCLGAQPFLDSGYTVFGDALDEESLGVIHSLAKGDEIHSVVVESGAPSA